MTTPFKVRQLLPFALTLAIVFAVGFLFTIDWSNLHGLVAAHCTAPAGGALLLGSMPLFGTAMLDADFQAKVLGGVTSLAENVKGVGDDIAMLKSVANDHALKLQSLQSRGLSGGGLIRPPGTVCEEYARSLASSVLLHTERSGKLEALIPNPRMRATLLAEARDFAGVTRAMSTTEVPLPTTYGSDFIELIAEFGVCRREMQSYPLGGGIAKPPRMGTRPAFGSIAMSGAVDEKKPTIGFCTLTPHKLGGIVILPREIEEQSIVQMGQFMAQYGAVEFARAEDTWGFMADGSATYEGVKGVCKICTDNDKAVVLANTKTKPSDATLDDFRKMRSTVSTAALAGGCYYLNNSWESKLRAFNTALDTAFVYRPDGTATLDGFPITWTEVLEPYGTVAAAGKYLAAFGRLRFWYFAQRGNPRIDTSEHVYFMNDQLATRFLEEIDFDYLSLEAMSVLQTAAA